MKTTVEIADDLALALKDRLRENGLTMRAALDEAIRKWLRSKAGEKSSPSIDPAVGVIHGEGLSPEFSGKVWEEIRDASYGETR